MVRRVRGTRYGEQVGAEDEQGGSAGSALARIVRDLPLRRRVDRLEEQVDELQRLSLRIAELTDVVEALVVPLARADRAALDEVLERYAGVLHRE